MPRLPWAEREIDDVLNSIQDVLNSIQTVRKRQDDAARAAG
jgi:hypothetical protein